MPQDTVMDIGLEAHKSGLGIKVAHVAACCHPLHPNAASGKEGTPWSTRDDGEKIQKKRYVKQTYVKMSVEEKETLKQRMVEINKAAAGDKKNMPPSLTPM
jgi:hypothetical protein